MDSHINVELNRRAKVLSVMTDEYQPVKVIAAKLGLGIGTVSETLRKMGRLVEYRFAKQKRRNGSAYVTVYEYRRAKL